MSLKSKINDDLKDALKKGEKIRLQTIRSIRALILEFEKSGKGDKITPDVEIQLLTSASKKRKESIEQFGNAGRTDLVDKEKEELEIILSYLPKQLSEDEIMDEIKILADELNASSKEDFPKLMPAAIKALKGKADGKVIKKIVETILSSN